jgi:O-methyltransferase
LTLPRLLHSVKRLVYRLLLHKRRMAFPSFAPTIHADLQGRQDYVRYAGMALALERIEGEAVQGALAEVGVYRGETSRLIRALRPNRKLYLFDTFEGFPQSQLEAFQAGDVRFQDTSIEAVRASVEEGDQVVIREGLVPETFAGLEQERFAFVLLDLDLHLPTLQSLEFFYPRISPGGYLIVHDYNSPESNWACKRAFDAFLQDKPEPLIEWPDIWGTALIRKARQP